MISNSITILYIAGREAEYSRTAIMRKGLEKAGFDVIGIFPPNKRFRFYPGLIWQFLLKKKYCDLIIIGFYGQLLLPLIRLFTRKPILYDIYISTYDIMVYDRQRAKRNSLRAIIYKYTDRWTMLWADRILLETRDHILDYSKKFKIPVEKFQHLFLAVDDSLISPQSHIRQSKNFLVHFHGEFAPFHGVKTILEAAHLLKDEDVEFEIIGTGITYQDDQVLADRLHLKNVRFIDWVPYNKLAESMLRAHCCLGIFGDNPRTFRLLTNKVVEALAVARPLITLRNNPVQELLKDGESVILVPPAQPAALADAIRLLRDKPDLAKKIAENGFRRFKEQCTLDVFSERLKEIINHMVAA